MNKKGFTLTELLAVIVLIGIVSLLVTPNLIKLFKDNTSNTMKVQESEINDAALLYLEDFCKNPLGTNRCPSTIYRNSDYTFSGKISLDTIVLNGYIDTIKLKSTTCTGCVVFEKNKSTSYIKCGEDYITENYSCD